MAAGGQDRHVGLAPERTATRPPHTPATAVLEGDIELGHAFLSREGTPCGRHIPRWADRHRQPAVAPDRAERFWLLDAFLA